MGKLAQQLSGQSQVHVYKKGGPVHTDEAMDKKLIKKEIKKAIPSAKMSHGGKYSKNMMKKGGKV